MTMDNHEEESNRTHSAEIIISEDYSSEMDAEREASQEAENREDSRFKEGQVFCISRWQKTY